MRHYFYSHQGASEAFPNGARVEIEAAIDTCTIRIERGSAASIRDHLVKSLGQSGWPDEFQVEPPSKITIASLKDGVGLCMQTGGNMSRMYADLLKLQKLYLEDAISSGGIILPTSKASRDLGDNIANADRLAAELKIFRRVIHMPIAVFSFE
jgi:hypothetical protein